MKKILTLILLAGFMQAAHAADSTHLTCTGYTTNSKEGQKVGITVQFSESRGEVINNEQTRKETLSVVWANKLYQDTVVQGEDDDGYSGAVILSETGKKNIFFVGSYSYDFKTAKLTLKGKINLEPENAKSTLQPINTSLKCVDISS